MTADIEKLKIGTGETETFKGFAKGWRGQTPMIVETVPARDGVEIEGFSEGLLKQEFQGGKLVRVVWSAQ